MAEAEGVVGDLIESNYGIKSLLCLATSVHEDGTPIQSTDSLRRHLPIRVLATIKRIEEGNTKFAISFNNDPRDSRDFNWKLNSFYSDPENRQEVDKRNIEIGETYVCAMGNTYKRCRLESMDAKNCQVYLFDSSEFAAVLIDDLFYIDTVFHGDELDYAFSLSCSTPAPGFLEAVKLPTLDKFRVNEVVEVIICSLVEPCLAVLGSITKHFSRIRPETVIQGMSAEDIQNWQTNFLDSEPSFSGVLHGQYPAVQPYLFDIFSLVTVVAYVSLEEVYVRDILSSVRLSYLQEIVNDFYGAEQCRQQMQFSEHAELLPDLPCVVFDVVSKQYIRAKVLRLSGDRSIADLRGVDYPNIVIKAIEVEKMFSLSERFNLQPQCFAVSLVDLEDAEKVYHLSAMAKHFLSSGSVASAASHVKDTLITIKCADDADVLGKIGYSKMISEDKPPLVQTVDSQAFSSDVPHVPSVQKPSILKNSDYEKPKKNIPMGSIAALVAHIAGPNAVFLRTAELSESYGKLQEKITQLMDGEQKWLIRHDELKAGKIYMLKGAKEREWRRIYILTKDSALDIKFQDVDTGEVVDVVGDGFADELRGRICKAPAEIAEWRKPLVCPFRLSTNSNSDYLHTPEAMAVLSKLLPGDEKVYFLDCAEFEDDSPADLSSSFGLRPKPTSKELKMPKPREVKIFKSDGSVVNDLFDGAVKKIATEEEEQKSAWSS